MKEEIRNLTIEEFWEKYSNDYDYITEKAENEFFGEYCKTVVMYIGDFYEDGIDRDILVYSDYQHFEFSRIEYFDEDDDFVDYNYSLCARNEGSPVEYQPDAKMSDVFGDIYNEVKERYLRLFNDMKSYIEDEEYDGEDVLSSEFDTLEIDFIEQNADKLGIEYYYDDRWDMHITKIEKVWI